MVRFDMSAGSAEGMCVATALLDVEAQSSDLALYGLACLSGSIAPIVVSGVRLRV